MHPWERGPLAFNNQSLPFTTAINKYALCCRPTSSHVLKDFYGGGALGRGSTRLLITRIVHDDEKRSKHVVKNATAMFMVSLVQRHKNVHKNSDPGEC